MRDVGSGFDITIIITYLDHRNQISHEIFSSYLTPFNQCLQQAVQAGVHDLSTPPGLMTLDKEVARQAETLAYLQDFRLMMFITLSAVPMTLLLSAPAKNSQSVLGMD